jgi:peptidoglycan/LPS O-acetylase OafA/YrhL
LFRASFSKSTRDIDLRSIAQTLPSIAQPRPDDAIPALLQGGPASSPSVHLDALRGFAAVSVLLNHWRDAFFADYSQISHNSATAAAYLAAGLGHQWVIVFFVMSGYLVGGSVLRSVAAGRWSWRSYLLARLTRLYIVLLPALILGGVIDHAGMHIPGAGTVYSGKSGMHALEVDVYATSRPATLLANSLFLQTIALPGMHHQPVSTFGSNGPLWSLCNEFWYYMAFPIVVFMMSNGPSWRTRLGCGLGLLILGWFVGPGILLLGIPWLMGALINYLPRIRAKRLWLNALIVASALSLFVGCLIVGKLREGSLVTDLVLGVAFSLLIWVTLYCATSPLPKVYSRLAKRAARSSYTLYLVHLPMLVFLKAALHAPRSIPSLHAFLISVTIFIVVLIYAQLVYQIFERNTERVRSWVRAHWFCPINRLENARL